MIDGNGSCRTNYSSVAGFPCSSQMVVLAGVGLYDGVFHT